MNRTRVFVSSTYFDLAQVRDDIHATLAGMGHQPILSELRSFPVLPDLSTIENCRRNVRENTDIFVLIVGGRRGSLDPASDRSIVNIEYDAAVQAGLTILVFVSEDVQRMLPVWEKNPNMDVSTYVDSADVFRFVKRIRDTQRWTFGFQRASEIAETLKIQLSTLLRYLLDRRRGNRLDPLPEFAHESQLANELALDRPRFWEHLLTSELLRVRLVEIHKRLNDLGRGLTFQRSRNMRGQEYMDYVQAKCTDCIAAVEMIKVAIEEEIPASWGAPGVSGDPMHILDAVNKVSGGCAALVDWEIDLASVHPPQSFVNLKDALRGTTQEIVNEFDPLPGLLTDAIQRAREHTGPEPLKVEINFALKWSRGEIFRKAIADARANLDPSEW
jgi:hypothetical protein